MSHSAADRWCDENDAARERKAERDATQALVTELLMVVGPIARAADNFDNMPVSDPESWFAYKGESSDVSGEPKGAITVGDLRRARNTYLKVMASIT